MWVRYVKVIVAEKPHGSSYEIVRNIVVVVVIDASLPVGVQLRGYKRRLTGLLRVICSREAPSSLMLLKKKQNDNLKRPFDHGG